MRVARLGLPVDAWIRQMRLLPSAEAAAAAGDVTPAAAVAAASGRAAKAKAASKKDRSTGSPCF
jgi:hypothetical protein